MGRRLDARVTEITFEQLAAAFRVAWQKQLGHSPKPESLAVLLAQSALETGRWKHCYCFNLGNAKATEAWTSDYCFYEADEIVNPDRAATAFALRKPRTDGSAGSDVSLTSLQSGKVQVTLHADHPWARFRAFTSLEEGVEDYLGLLHTRFAGAWPAVEQGDPEAFVRTLHELKYFTASVERYLPPVNRLFDEFLPKLSSFAAEPAISSEAQPALERGDTGDAVRQVQRILLALSYDELSPSGVFDERTVRAVERFQAQHSDDRGLPLETDGKIGKHTWWALRHSLPKS
jgi:hypothetical protein